MKTFKQFMDESKKCWPGYKKKGTKKLFGKTYNNCVKENYKNFYKSMIQQEEFIDPETGASPSGRSPIENVSYHPNKKVREKAMRAFAKQMAKEYGGRWKSKVKDPVQDD